MSVNPPSEEQGIDWLMEQTAGDSQSTLLALRLSGFAPLKAVELLNSKRMKFRTEFMADMAGAAEGRLEPAKIAAGIYKEDLDETIGWMYSLALDAKKFQHQLSSELFLNSDQLKLVNSLASSPVSRLDSWIDRLQEARRLLATTSNINPQLLAEDLLFRWIAIFK